MEQATRLQLGGGLTVRLGGDVSLYAQADYQFAPDSAFIRNGIQGDIGLAMSGDLRRLLPRRGLSDRCLTKDREALLAFFDFPAEHWDHLRTSNPIESVFATVRHRTVRTKGALSAKTAKLMVFKLVNAAAKTWRRLKGENQLPKVVQGVKFQNGIEVIKMSAHHAA